ncbi:MAG: copper chaperone PCu(A)C [Hyphomicrobium sp.]
MRNLRTLAATLAVAAVTAVLSAAIAQEYKAGSLMIDRPWARPTIGSSKNSAAYMTLSNNGDSADKLLAVKSDAAEHVALHESRMDGEIMRMVPVKDGIEVPPHGEVELKPLGLHVMLMGLHKPLKEGEKFPMTLVFAKQGDVKVEVKVEKKPQAKKSGQDMHQHH